MNGQIESHFWENVPRKFMASMFRALIVSHQAAWEYCRTEFEAPEAYNLEPFWRREKFEQHIRACAAQFPDEVQAECVKGGNFWNHTRVVCGKVTLTQSSAPHPGHLVQSSECRRQYALPNGQLSLFDTGTKKAPDPDQVLFGILLHGRDLLVPGRLGFAVIRFPNADLTDYMESRVDLFREFPHIADELYPTTTGSDENIGDLPDIELLGEGEAG